MAPTKHRLTRLLESADIRPGGDRPWDITIHDDRFFERFPADGSIGLGESYMDGWWDAERVDQTVHHMLAAGLEQQVRSDRRLLASLLWSRLINRQSRRRARDVAERHYDLDADLYMSFLDRWNQYTCGYWNGLRESDQNAGLTAAHEVSHASSAGDAMSIDVAAPAAPGAAAALAVSGTRGTSLSAERTLADAAVGTDATGSPDTASMLEAAQEAKLDLICRKLQLRPGERVLDIGCGWGGFARFAAERYDVGVTGVTISSGQAAYARDFCDGLNVDIVETDYRDIPSSTKAGSFDRVLVCGMIEHVGYKNYRALMKSVRHALRDGGLFLLHTIGRDTSATAMTTHGWIDRYIFPNGMIPSLQQLTRAAEGLFVIEDLHQFGADHYDRTLMAWHHNFEASWSRLRERYDERFRRMWNFYLLSCAGGFRAGLGRLWQIVMSKGDGVQEGYAAVR